MNLISFRVIPYPDSLYPSPYNAHSHTELCAHCARTLIWKCTRSELIVNPQGNMHEYTHTHCGTKPGRLSHELGMSDWASEQTNTWAVWANEWTDEQVDQYLRPDSWLFWTTARLSYVYPLSKMVFHAFKFQILSSHHSSNFYGCSLSPDQSWVFIFLWMYEGISDISFVLLHICLFVRLSVWTLVLTQAASFSFEQNSMSL